MGGGVGMRALGRARRGKESTECIELVVCVCLWSSADRGTCDPDQTVLRRPGGQGELPRVSMYTCVHTHVCIHVCIHVKQRKAVVERYQVTTM